jgi:hypothetical protein
MSYLEIIGLVAGIIGAFSSTGSFLANRKKQKVEKARAKAEELAKLQTAVVTAPPQIQHEYDRDFARIGPRFAAGDCKLSASYISRGSWAVPTVAANTAIARNQLTNVLINMQQNMTSKLQQLFLSTSSNPVINYTSLFDISDRSRLDSISALAQQYQRFSTTVPIARNTLSLQSSVKMPKFCPGRLSCNAEVLPYLICGSAHHAGHSC